MNATVASTQEHFTTRIAGLTSAASELNVSREHLRLVVHGKRQSPELLARYNELTAGSRAHLADLDRAEASVTRLAADVAALAAPLGELTRARAEIRAGLSDLRDLLTSSNI